MNKLAVIPARMASSRFPGKPLKQILGVSMIEHVYKRTMLCKNIDRVIVATCDDEIYDEVKSFKGEVMMTSPLHEGCVDRVAEVAQKHSEADIIVNVQGDIPMVDPVSLGELVEPLLKDKGILCTDMMGEITNESDFLSPNVVKVVTDLSSKALYYSREAIPSLKKCSATRKTLYKQFGINAFRRDFLLNFTKMDRTPLENIESIDMLRVLENSISVQMVYWGKDIVGVDVAEDIERAAKMLEQDELFLGYSKEKD